jgi:uncharacterized protein (DUF302 family)
MTAAQEWSLSWKTQLAVQEATDRIEREAANHGFRILKTHNVSETLRDKGFESSEYRIVEICNAKYTSQALAADPMVGLWMPCPIIVFEQNGGTHVATVKTTLIAGFFPDVELGPFAADVERIVRDIVDAALKG